jgi:hypothetical protein
LQRKGFFSASYDLWKGVYETIHQKFYKLSSKLFMGFYFVVCREKVFSLHLIIFEKGSMTLLTKSFTSYHPNYLWVFILWFVEKRFFLCIL